MERIKKSTRRYTKKGRVEGKSAEKYAHGTLKKLKWKAKKIRKMKYRLE